VRRATIIGLVVAAALAGVVAFLLLRGQDGDDTATPTPATTPSPTAQPLAQWPLTGLPTDEEVVGPVVAVKVDNTANAFPQRGLDLADIVVEEPVEGGVTRLAVLMHSALPSAGEGVTGPVRSVRSSDIGVVAPADAVLLASGGAAPPVADIEAAGIETRFEGTEGFFRDPSRRAPYNLFVDVVQARAALTESAAPPPYFTWASPGDVFPAGTPAQSVVLRFSPAQSTALAFDGTSWTRTLDTPDGFTATTVIALLVQQQVAGYLDPGGNPVPITITEGTGQGWMASSGSVVDIEWSKPTAASPWSFRTADGQNLPVPPGRTYLALLPAGTGSLQGVDSSG